MKSAVHSNEIQKGKTIGVNMSCMPLSDYECRHSQTEIRSPHPLYVLVKGYIPVFITTELIWSPTTDPHRPHIPVALNPASV